MNLISASIPCGFCIGRDALLPYRPDEACFVTDGCAFPDDGGWYWSVREADEDRISLNGCGGDTYCIYRPR